MSKDFNCPNCGAPLDYAGGDEATLRCPFCNTSVIIPEELRTKPAAASVPTFDPAQFANLANLGQLAGQKDKLRELGRLVRADQKIEAIKLYREIFGVGLKEAKDAVEAMSEGKGVQLTSITLGTPGQSESGSTSFPTAPSFTPPISKPRSGGAGTIIGCLVGIIPALAIVLGLSVAIFSVLPATIQASLSDAVGQFIGGYAHVVLRFGSEGIGPGRFTDARSIAVDADGHIYVGEYTGSRIQAFDASGKFLKQWNAGDKKSYLSSLAVSRKGIVYAVVGGKISSYDGATGNPLGEIAPSGDSNYFEYLTVNAEDQLVSVVNGEDLLRLDTHGKVMTTVSAAISSISENSELDTRVAVDGSGNIYALGTFNNAVFKFTPAGKFVTRFGSEGDEHGQFRAPYAIAVDGQGRVYVSDFKGIQVFDPDGRYLAVIGVDKFVYGMTFNDQNELFVINGTQVIKFALKQ